MIWKKVFFFEKSSVLISTMAESAYFISSFVYAVKLGISHPRSVLFVAHSSLFPFSFLLASFPVRYCPGSKKREIAILDGDMICLCTTVR